MARGHGALGRVGSPVARVIIRGDEVDDMLASGTRITYVLGGDQSAAHPSNWMERCNWQ